MAYTPQTPEEIAKGKAKLEKVKAKKKEEKARKQGGEESAPISVSMTPEELEAFKEFQSKKNQANMTEGKPIFKQIKNETPEIKEIFEFWYNAGEQEPKSINETARQFNKSRKTITNYIYSFDWEKRRIDRMKRVGETLAERAEMGEINSLASYRQIFKKLTDQAKRDIESGILRIRSIKDLAMIAELEIGILQAEAEAENDNELKEGKLGALVDVLSNMPMTQDPRTKVTVQTTTTTMEPMPKPANGEVID